jgi:hypothetical protein
MRAFLIGNGNRKLDHISAAQLFPFFDNHKLLTRRLGLDFNHLQAITLADIRAAFDQIAGRFDLAFVRPSWREQPEEMIDTFRTVRSTNPGAKIVFIDPWDQENTRFFGVLPYVDWFLKYQALKDVSEYKREYAGGTIITDFLVKEWGFDLNGWHVGSTVPDGYENRIATGWSVGVDERFKTELCRHHLWPHPRKDIDIFCRVSLGAGPNLEWYGQYRQRVVDLLRDLVPTCKLALSAEFDTDRSISFRRYCSELRHTRIVVSPFGWGPLTWRDYEAVINDALLVKPNLDRLDIAPNIYIPGETYIPVRWDLSDLIDVCRYYLEDHAQRERIVRNARKAYAAYFSENRFVERIEQLVRESPSARHPEIWNADVQVPSARPAATGAALAPASDLPGQVDKSTGKDASPDQPLKPDTRERRTPRTNP